ncbi:MAG: D-aminoacyl-tRNA deacylase [Planctomycetota bacterium]|nr:D-aminoacyl-tRNA deacylase [Planctomycetota bacterium]
MKTVIQRVCRAEVSVNNEVVGRIDRGALCFVGVEQGDQEADADATAQKIANLRFFPGKTPMDLTLAEVGGACLMVSQFTLAGSLRKGNRPSFTQAENPALAEQLYLRVADHLRDTGLTVETGQFAADMRVDLVNDGPVTLLLFTRDGKVI